MREILFTLRCHSLEEIPAEILEIHAEREREMHADINTGLYLRTNGKVCMMFNSTFST